MALTVTLKDSGFAGANDTGEQVSEALDAITFAAGSHVLVLLGATNNTNAQDAYLTCSAPGLTFATEATAFQAGTAKASMRAFSAPHASGGSTVITVGTDDDDIFGVFYAVYEITGHDTDDPIGATAVDADDVTDGAYTITLNSAPDSSSVVIAGIHVDTDPGTNSITVGTGWTEDAEVDSSGSNFGVGQFQRRTGSTSTTVTWDDVRPNGSVAVYSAAALAVEVVAGAVGGTDATATPAVIATTVAVPQSTVNAGTNATPTPAVIAATTILPQAGVNISAAPATITATVDMPQWAINMSIQPSVTSITIAVPMPTIQAGGSVTAQPATITATVTLPKATAAVDWTTTPGVITAMVTFPRAAVGTLVGPAVVPVVVTVPQASPDIATGGNPATIAAAVTIPAAGVNVGASPDTIELTVTFNPADVGARVNAESIATVAAFAASTAIVSAATTSTPTVTN